MHLRYISIPQLIAEAQGDPWAINESLQKGCPAQISELGQAFHSAGMCSISSYQAFAEARKRFEAAWNRKNGDHPINDSAEVQRVIQSFGPQCWQLDRISVDLENIAAALAEAQRTSGALIATLENKLQQTDDSLGAALDLENEVDDTSDLDALIDALERGAVDDTTSSLGQLQSTRDDYSDYLHGALRTLRADGYDPVAIQSVDAPGTPTKGAREREQNQIDAFTRVFGRSPVSTPDWETAAVLDPHSYDTQNGGKPPNILVGRIKPVPDQGVVRTNLFIPGRTVWDPQLDLPPYHENLGDNRGFSPEVGPEGSRVTIYVDYENGIIVARQNPSIDTKTNQIRVGTPSISAVQQTNGSVLLKYSAADPFSPGGEDLAKMTTLNVNGTIGIKPTPTGPRVGGTVTNFPAIEIYSDRPGDDPRPLVQSRPGFTEGVLGPAAGLWWRKQIGDHGIERSFDNQYWTQLVPGLVMPGFQHWLWPLGVHPGTYPLGPVDHPPEIGVHDPVVVRPLLPAN